jgi:hypothetical protein
MRLAGHTARWGRGGMQIGFRWQSLNERNYYEYLDVGVRIIFLCFWYSFMLEAE